VHGSLGAGKTAESQVVSALLPAQRLLSDTAAAVILWRQPWRNAHLPSLPLWLVFSPSAQREGRMKRTPEAVVLYLRHAELWKVTGNLQASVVVLGVPI